MTRLVSSTAVLKTECPDLKLVARGKVRDIYEVDATSLLFVATDRLSAFDVVMQNGIPGKGKILTQLTEFWLDRMSKYVETHLITSNIDQMPTIVHQYRNQLTGRSMLVKKLDMLEVECIIRGYITGSGWKEYEQSKTVCGIPLPNDLKQCQKLMEPLYTPSSKAEVGDHDENISPEKAAELIGMELNSEMAKVAINIYNDAHSFLLSKNIMIADTKFEFGLNKQTGKLVLADEVLTPDCSRFWPLLEYEVGRDQNSYDKQIVRNFLESINFDKKTSVALPQTVIDATMKKYIEVFVKITGKAPDL